jgi:hypothetical protein
LPSVVVSSLQVCARNAWGFEVLRYWRRERERETLNPFVGYLEASK